MGQQIERQERLQNNETGLLLDIHDSCHVHLDTFDGPLDLLLHLIKKNEVDICNISIAEVTRQYLDYLKLMKELNLEIAGDFLVMAATLLQIKSRMLLPDEETEEGNEDDTDPRSELIRRLLEYQQYREAGMVIGARAVLGREVFQKGAGEPCLKAARDTDGPLEISLFDLVDALRAILSRIPAENFHDVAAAEMFSIADCINEILELLQTKHSIQFDELFGGFDNCRERVIVTFLALLELCRLKLIRIFQDGPHGSIWFIPSVAHETADDGYYGAGEGGMAAASESINFSSHDSI